MGRRAAKRRIRAPGRAHGSGSGRRESGNLCPRGCSGAAGGRLGQNQHCEMWACTGGRAASSQGKRPAAAAVAAAAVATSAAAASAAAAASWRSGRWQGRPMQQRATMSTTAQQGTVRAAITLGATTGTATGTAAATATAAAAPAGDAGRSAGSRRAAGPAASQLRKAAGTTAPDRATETHRGRAGAATSLPRKSGGAAAAATSPVAQTNTMQEPVTGRQVRLPSPTNRVRRSSRRHPSSRRSSSKPAR